MKLFFIHLPKTGGVFLRNYFKDYNIEMFPVNIHAHDGISKLDDLSKYFTFG